MSETKAELVAAPTPMMLPNSVKELRADIPDTKKVCIEMATNALAQVCKVATLRYWHVGKILAESANRGEDIRDDVMSIVGCKDRLLRDCIKAYERYPDASDIYTLANTMDWSVVRKLIQLQNPELREQVVRQLEEGDVSKEKAPEYVQQLVQQEQEERAAETGKEDGRTAKAKSHNPSSVFAKASKAIVKMHAAIEKNIPDLKQSVDYVWTDAVPDEDLEGHQENWKELYQVMLGMAGLLTEQAEVLNKIMVDGPDEAKD